MKKIAIALFLIAPMLSIGQTNWTALTRTDLIYTAPEVDTAISNAIAAAGSADLTAISNYVDIVAIGLTNEVLNASNTLSLAIGVVSNDVVLTSNYVINVATSISNDITNVSNQFFLALGTVSNDVVSTSNTLSAAISALGITNYFNSWDISTNTLTLALADSGDVFRFTDLACTITIPSNSVVDWESVSNNPSFYFRIATTNMPSFADTGMLNDPNQIVANFATNKASFAIVYVTTNNWDVY